MESRAVRGLETRMLAYIARENECRYEWTDAHWASEETLKDIEKLYCIVCWKLNGKHDSIIVYETKNNK